MILKALLVWLAIAVAEVLHGMLRVRLLNRRVGNRRARQIAVFTGSGIILIIAWLTVPWIGVSSTADGPGVGLLWLALRLAFEIAFGLWVFRAPGKGWRPISISARADCWRLACSCCS